MSEKRGEYERKAVRAVIDRVKRTFELYLQYTTMPGDWRRVAESLARQVKKELLELEPYGIHAETMDEAMVQYDQLYKETPDEYRDRKLEAINIKAVDEAEKIALKIAVAVEAQKKIDDYLGKEETKIRTMYGLSDEQKNERIAALKTVAAQVLQNELERYERNLSGRSEVAAQDDASKSADKGFCPTCKQSLD